VIDDRRPLRVSQALHHPLLELGEDLRREEFPPDAREQSILEAGPGLCVRTSSV
jgi:hypothetical protein